MRAGARAARVVGCGDLRPAALQSPNSGLLTQESKNTLMSCVGPWLLVKTRGLWWPETRMDCSGWFPSLGVDLRRIDPGGSEVQLGFCTLRKKGKTNNYDTDTSLSPRR